MCKMLLCFSVLENLAQDQNHPVLLDPAAVAVVRAPTARVDFNAQGPARSSRTRHKCPVEGCPITRNSQEALNVHIDNSHDWFWYLTIYNKIWYDDDNYSKGSSCIWIYSDNRRVISIHLDPYQALMIFSQKPTKKNYRKWKWKTNH